MNEDLYFRDVYGALIAAVPELDPLITAEMGSLYDWPDEAPQAGYPMIEDVVKPFLWEKMRARVNDELVHRLFEFLEKMANSNDSAVVDLLRIGICEDLAYYV